jgi:hypothetical protein
MSEGKALKVMMRHKLDRFIDVKKNLEFLKRENKKLNIKKLKSELFETRQIEIKYLIDFTLLCSLIEYFNA